MMLTALSKRGLLLLAAICLNPGAGELLAQWESWRGPRGTGYSDGTDYPSSFTPGGENVVWQKPIGGRSTPVVHGGNVYTLSLGGEGIEAHEQLTCFDAETGEVKWTSDFNVFHTTIPGPRVGWASPCVDPETGYIYIHGVQGLFRCYTPEGKIVWSRSLTEDQGRISGYGGRTHTPVVDGDLVILSFLNSSLGAQGPGKHRYMACDKRTGEIVWWSDPGGQPLDTTYSTPVVTLIHGMRALICPAADGAVHALKVRTGEKIWSYRLSKRGFNVSPVVVGKRLYVAHSEENLDTTHKGTVACIDIEAKPDDSGDITESGKVWRTDGLEVGYSSPLYHDGILYVVDNPGNLIALDAENGKELWRHSLGTVGKGSPVLVDGKIYVGEVNGRFSIVEPSRESCKELSQYTFESDEGFVVEIFGSPAVARGRIYFTTSLETYCIGKEDWKGQAATSPAPLVEPEIDRSAPVAHVQIRPAEVILSPGQKAEFTLHTFNERGQPLGSGVEATEWTLKGLLGTLDEGRLSIPVVSRHQFGLVEARVGDHSTSARVRVVPDLPITEDFDALMPGQLPTGWLGASPPKFRIVDLDGERVLMKHGTRFELKFMRARAYIGPSSLKNYTIQADLRGDLQGRKMPDMGLINQRYEIYMMGHRRPTGRKLRVISWVADRRVFENVAFPWEPGKWYTLKFSVSPAEGGALVRGKVWEKGTAEPADWTIQTLDPRPNLEGSPGIYAFSAGTTQTKPGTNVYFDNIVITPNP